jgi:hypothetical protein
MKTSMLTTIGAAAALSLALGFGSSAFAQTSPDMPAPDAGAPAAAPSGGGESGAMPMPAPKEGGAMSRDGAPADGAEAVPADRPEGATRQDRVRPGAAGGDKAAAGADKKGDRAAETDKSGAAADKADKKGDRGEGKAAATIGAEQKSKITSYFKSNKPDVKVIDKSSVNISVGIAVPGTIHLHPIPADIIVVAGDCSVLFFLWGPDLVLVDSCTRHVVDIIPGIA